jgi:hypothetical protein
MRGDVRRVCERRGGLYERERYGGTLWEGGSSLFSLVCRSEAMALAPAATAPNYELNPKRPHAFADTDLHRAHDSHFTVFTSRLGVRLSRSLISLH